MKGVDEVAPGGKEGEKRSGAWVPSAAQPWLEKAVVLVGSLGGHLYCAEVSVGGEGKDGVSVCES